MHTATDWEQVVTSLVGHVREVRLNGASEAITVEHLTGNPTQGTQLYPFQPSPSMTLTWISAPLLEFRSTSTYYYSSGVLSTAWPSGAVNRVWPSHVANTHHCSLFTASSEVHFDVLLRSLISITICTTNSLHCSISHLW